MFQKKYRIKPLPLSVMAIDKSILTYRLGYGTKIDVANCMFYIEGADKNIIVDTATDSIQAREIRGFAAQNIMSFEQALASVGLKPENVDTIIQTHLHWDHCVNVKNVITPRAYSYTATRYFVGRRKKLSLRLARTEDEHR